MQTSFVRHSAFYSSLCLTVAAVFGCAATDADDEVESEPHVTVASQAVTLPAPDQNPQACSLPSGRYVGLARATSSPGVYNVTFHNDAVQGGMLSIGCKTMILIWNEATAPVPPVPPTDDLFHTFLFEGWWANSPAGAKHFSVKAAWQTPHSQGVVTAVNSTLASAYILYECGFGHCADLINCIAAGTDTNHICRGGGPIPGQRDDDSYVIGITGANRAIVQRLYLQSGTSRLPGNGTIATMPCIVGAVCPSQLPP
jgi:hypothetical protein